jgi:hypothetical protein
MKKTLSFSAALLFLIGCGTTQVWYQPGKTSAQAHADLADAQAEATKLITPEKEHRSLGQQIADGNHIDDFIKHRMMGLGWQIVPANSISNAASYPHP